MAKPASGPVTRGAQRLYCAAKLIRNERKNVHHDGLDKGRTPFRAASQRNAFQDLILTLQSFWSAQGCVILQPYDMEVGAGTFHPATTLRALGPKPWTAAYVQPSRRPKDGRYGENPNRLQHYYQFQVIMKPSPANIQELYLASLEAIGIDTALNDIRFVEDDWESPTLGAWGLGWEVLVQRHGSVANSPISSRSAASTAIRSPARSPTGSSVWPCTSRASTASST